MDEKPLRILMIDDNPEDQEMVRRYLTRGWSISCFVTAADNGHDGMLQFERERPDCLLLDFHLPDMNGLEFLAQVIRLVGPDVMPVVVLTGTGSEAIAVEAMKSGAHDYLIKADVTPDRLRRAILQAIEQIHMLRQLESQRRALEEKNEELRVASRRKDEFLAMLAHELRNPLAATRNAIEIIKRSGGGDNRFHQALEVLERQALHQSRLLDDLLDVSRITRGKVLLRLEPVDLRELVRHTAQAHLRILEDAGLALRMELPEEAVWVRGDPIRLSQMLDNLLNNALKFSNAGGEVHLCLQAQPRCAEISVRDTGMGISAEMLPHIFETFAQADRTLDRSRGGLGLGLAVVRGLAELHGGTIRVSSAGAGQGAEFRLELPRVEPPAPGAMPRSRIPPLGKHGRVLVIEDNRDAAETLRDLLELAGHQVEVAYAGNAGVELARRFQPDVVLCDLGLPGLDGYEVARVLRSGPGLEGTRLIAVSGYGQAEDRERAREAGFNLHLTKPVDPLQLEEIIQEALRSRA